MGIWGENRELLDQFRRRIASNPEGVLAMIDDMNLPEHRLGLGGTAFKRMEIPSQVPHRLERWYRAKDFYIGKVMPEYNWAFSDRLFKEMKKDFLALLPLYQLLDGISENIM